MLTNIKGQELTDKMKQFPLLLLLCMLTAFADAFAQDEVSGVYVGGHIRRQRPGTITTLRNSGFTYVILFNVHVDTDGTLKTDGETICKDGEYVFQNTQPYYQQDIKNLKTAPTGISRIDICIGGWGNDSYTNIKNLIASGGTGKSSILYRNFKALKEAVPEIDAVNNDDEQTYDVSSAAKFHIMMYDLGYKTTLAPYTYKSFWTSLCSQIRSSRPKAVDRVMIQCYDGGAGNVNSVGTWEFAGVTNRHAGLLNYSNDWSIEKNTAQFEKWRDDGVAKGGFVWVYNDESWNLNGWASAINRTYGPPRTVPEDRVVVRCYSEKNYGGYCIPLTEGIYTQADLALHGLAANDLSSVEILDDNYRVKLYTSANCTGTFMTRSVSGKNLATAFDNKVCSIKVEVKPGGTGINGTTADDDILLTAEGGNIIVENAEGEQLCIYDMAGKLVSQDRILAASQAVSLSSLPRGNYIVRVADKAIRLLR